MKMYEQTAYQCLLALKDIVVAKDKGNGEDIRLEQTFQYGVIQSTLYKNEKLMECIKEYFKIKSTIDKYERLKKKDEIPNELWVKLRYAKKEIMKLLDWR